MTEEIVAGRNAVFEALTSKRPINKIFIKAGLQGGSLGKIVAAAQEAAIPVEYVQAEKIDRLAPGMRHQGIVALASPIAFSTLEDVLQRAASRNETPFLLLLDELQDPQNVGALIRSADAAGVHGVLLPRRRSCPTLFRRFTVYKSRAFGLWAQIWMAKVCILTRTWTVLWFW